MALLIIAGKVYLHSTTTPIENVVVTVRNINQGESHNGNETIIFPELKTNSVGEFQCNLENFDTDFEDEDLIEVSLNHNDQKDIIFFTINGNQSTNSLVLTPMPVEPYDYERGLDEGGSKIKIYRTTRTLEDEYKSVETETVSSHPIQDETFASVQIEEDEEEHLEQGVVSHGEASAFFKIRYDVQKDDKIQWPIDSDNWWSVQNKPVRVSFGNNFTHDEARLVRIDSEQALASAVNQVIRYFDGSECSGNNSEMNRVLTVTTASTPSLIKVSLDGLRLRPDVHYTISTTSTNITITFNNTRVFDTQYIVVDYFI